MSDYIITEYKEGLSNLNKYSEFGNGGSAIRMSGPGNNLDSQSYQHDDNHNDNSAKDSKKDKKGDEDDEHVHHEDEHEHRDGDVVFIEEVTDENLPDEFQFSEEFSHFDSEEGLSEEDTSVGIMEGTAEEVAEEIGKRIPGVEVVIVQDEDDDKDKKETDWENDRDPKQFITYISRAYPKGIPKHDGSSTLGCERAIHYLKKLDKEISLALKTDKDNFLSPHLKNLEDIRISLNKDINTLSDHANYLRDRRKKKANSDLDLSELIKEAQLTKTASTPRIQLVVTPFERAICGIIINSVVSAGRPFETVYEFLKEKYDLNEREELSVLQILKDMGHPLFKDRGTIGNKNKEDGEVYQGIDFITNYFA